MVLTKVFSLMSPAGEQARLSVLIFHRVLPTPDPLFPEEMDAARFDALCRWVKTWFNVLPLDQAVRRLKNHSLPERALSITFDDGYADNFEVALPVLQRHGLTSTFFVSTGFLDGGRMWNDTVIESIRCTSLSQLDAASLGVAGLGLLDLGAVDARRAAIDAVIRQIKYLPIERRLQITQQLAFLAGVTPPTNLMMTSGQVQAMRRAGMQIGAHTVSHPILAKLDQAAAREEISQSKRRLEDLLDEPVTLFAYPNGKPGEDYSPQAVAIVKDLGFEGAVSTAWGAARRNTDCLQIPRFTPWARHRLKFAGMMASNLMRKG